MPQTPSTAARRQYRLILALAVAAIVIAAGLPEWGRGNRYAGEERVLVTDVVDGDTIHVQTPEGRTTVRLKCIDTPETVHPRKPVQPYGPEASAFTKKSLTGKRVRLEFDSRDRIDRYGRTLAYVFLDEGTFFNEELVRLGLARTTHYPCRYRHDVEVAQAEAQRAGRGLWSLTKQFDSCLIVGNSDSKVYHLPDHEGYRIADANRVCFATEEEAANADYRRSKK
jgi:micrococcal nuclease